MAPEPSHLVNITKKCPRCNNAAVMFMYFNNRKKSQPRYKCLGCGRLFTYGGKCRTSQVEQAGTTSTTAVVVAAAHRRTTERAAARGGEPHRNQRTTTQSGTQEIQETSGSTCARTEARTAATTSTRARSYAVTVAAATGTMAVRPTIGALGLPRSRIPISEPHRESAVLESPVRSPVEGLQDVVPVPAARIAGLVPGDVVDVDQRHTASRTAATVIAQGGELTESLKWTKAVTGVPPFGLVPACK